MRLPKTWMKIGDGQYLHLETGVETRRDQHKWHILAPHPNSSEFREVWWTGDNARALSDAVVIAADKWLPQARAQLAAAWDDAPSPRSGRPQGGTPARADKATTAPRRTAVAATGTP